MNSKIELIKEGFNFDFGWTKSIELKLWNTAYKADVIIVAFDEDEPLLDKQITSYTKIEELTSILNNEKFKIIEKLNDLYEADINEENLNKQVIIKQIIISDMDDIDFGIYCASNLDQENGIGIKIFNNRVIEVGLGDIVL